MPGEIWVLDSPVVPEPLVDDAHHLVFRVFNTGPGTYMCTGAPGVAAPLADYRKLL